VDLETTVGVQDELEALLVDQRVVPAAHQHEVAEVGGAAVFAAEKVVGVAEGGWSGAAAGGAAVVAGGQGAALGLGDGVTERFQAADLAEGVE
jgi:hypothetical protein